MSNGEFLRAAFCLLALFAGNFLYQFATAELWMVAAERSWFQACAICVYITFFQKATP